MAVSFTGGDVNCSPQRTTNPHLRYRSLWQLRQTVWGMDSWRKCSVSSSAEEGWGSRNLDVRGRVSVSSVHCQLKNNNFVTSPESLVHTHRSHRVPGAMKIG